MAGTNSGILISEEQDWLNLGCPANQNIQRIIECVLSPSALHKTCKDADGSDQPAAEYKQSVRKRFVPSDGCLMEASRLLLTAKLTP
ncbi:hypothetical protein DPMN_129399 [Dreissena polymorpha]|uniref:Uncharacterized protein n=1 Tax=Dreissena polymorpha TaxID=45954 RepID=A0A9D4H900_DREPO|nr:hypothetical protein DPMN_129399 [Dreissena polymorpha]